MEMLWPSFPLRSQPSTTTCAAPEALMPWSLQPDGRWGSRHSQAAAIRHHIGGVNLPPRQRAAQQLRSGKSSLFPGMH